MKDGKIFYKGQYIKPDDAELVINQLSERADNFETLLKNETQRAYEKGLAKGVELAEAYYEKLLNDNLKARLDHYEKYKKRCRSVTELIEKQEPTKKTKAKKEAE